MRLKSAFDFFAPLIAKFDHNALNHLSNVYRDQASVNIKSREHLAPIPSTVEKFTQTSPFIASSILSWRVFRFSATLPSHQWPHPKRPPTSSWVNSGIRTAFLCGPCSASLPCTPMAKPSALSATTFSIISRSFPRAAIWSPYARRPQRIPAQNFTI